MPGDAGDHRPRTRVRRVDDRLGLAVLRVPLSARTLVTYARDHVTVRTPSRPTYHDGNTLDLESPPAPASLAGWVDRFVDTVAQLGARHVQLRWEEPLAADEDPAPRPADDLAAAAAALGLTLTPHVVLLLDTLAVPAVAPARLEPVAAPSAVPGGAVDRRWHAATVLYRYEAQHPGPDGWRDWDEEAVAWRVEVQRELAGEQRARVWLASRHGAPVGRLTLTHDRQGLAAVHDLVVHPVHRRLGVGAALAHAAVAARLDVDPDARVGAAVALGSPALRLARRLGLRPHALVWTARGPVPSSRGS